MAWVSAYKTNAAGQLKGFLDDIITNYGLEGSYGWTIKDNNAGTNIGVYQCQPDANSKFVLVVRDNQADYATIEYWDDWDTDTHSGVGNSMTFGASSSYTLRVRKATGVYAAAINKQRIVLAIIGGGWAYYLGYPKRFDETKDTTAFIGHNSYTSGTNYSRNPLAGTLGGATNSGGGEWRWFRDSNGNINRHLASRGSYTSGIAYYTRMDTWTPNGKHYVIETPVQEDQSPNKLIGILDGVMCNMNCNSGRANGDTIVVGNDVWLVVVGSDNTTCFIKEA